MKMRSRPVGSIVRIKQEHREETFGYLLKALRGAKLFEWLCSIA